MEQDWMHPENSEDDGEKRRLVLKLITQLRCVACGKLYNPEDFVLVHRLQDVWVLSTSCRHCNDPCYVVVLTQESSEPESVLDLTPEEIEHAVQWAPITADDVLDVHALLQEFEGDFQALFAG